MEKFEVTCETILKMEKDELDIENPSYTIEGSSETLLPIQLFEFKAHLLETVEELRIARLGKIQYEEHINKILMEKQELIWKQESLSNQEEIVEKKHNDSLALLKKQMQAKICLIEEEKGRFELAAETKERENTNLREEIKALQIVKYTLQKKVHEMEQKLQLHILAKEDHIKQLSECKKCIGNVTQQFGMIKEVHEKLEQTAKTAIQTNKKLNIEINEKNNELNQLKEELKKLSSDFLNYKVTFKQRADEENISISEQYVKELKERLQTETEINKKLMEVNTNMKEGKQEDIRALSNMQGIAQRHTRTILSLESQLSALREDYKTLERDNELQRAKAMENEEKFLALQNEHEHAFTEWKAQKEILNIKCDAARKQLESMKELNHNSHKYNSESLNKTPETIIQAEEHQSIYNMCDIASNTFENIIQNDPEVSTNFHVSNSENDNLPLTSNEIQKMDESKVEIVHKDANNLQHVYSFTDKGHLSEERKDDSGLSENKDRFPTVEQNIRGSCDGKCTEEIPVNKTCLNVVDEYEERTDNLSTTIQKNEMAESIEMLPDYKIPTVCSEEASLQTDSSLQKYEDGNGEEVCIVNDKPDKTDYGQGVLKNETRSAESQLLSQTREQLISEQCKTNDSSPTGNSPSCVFEDTNNYCSPSLNRQTSDIDTQSCSNDQIQMGIEVPMLQTTENSHGLCGHSLFSELTEKNDLQSIKSKDIAKHCMDMVTSNTSVNTIEKEMKNKCLGQETIFTTSVSSQDPVDNLNLQSALDQVDCNVQALHYDGNTEVFNVKNVYFDVRKNCHLDIKKDTNMEETIECDINAESKLFTDNHCQLTDQNSDPGDVEEETVCIKENENVAAGCMSQEVGSKVLSKEEKSKPNGKSPINLTKVTKLVYLSRSDLRDRLNISPSKKTKLSCQDVISKDEHVPRNADQAFYNSSLPIWATSMENSNVVGKQNLCPTITESVGPYLINLPSSTSTEVTVTNKENYDISSIQRKISAIEKFLFNNKLNGSRKRKSEDTGIAED